MNTIETKLTWHGAEISHTIKELLQSELLQLGQTIKEISQSQAPLDTGALRENAHLDTTNLTSKSEIQITYDIDYAIRQHEQLNFHHPKGGKAKFLEDPFNQHQPIVLKHLGETIERNLK